MLLENEKIENEKIKSPEKFNFRTASPSDWEKLRKIKIESYKTDPQAFKAPSLREEDSEDVSYWTNLLLDSDKFFCVAEEDGAGFVSVAGAKKIDEDTWRIVSVYTLPDYRGQKLSGNLIQKAIEEVESRGAKKINLFVNTKQSHAISLYQKFGFEIVDTETEKEMGDGQFHDKHFMEKTLEQ